MSNALRSVDYSVVDPATGAVLRSGSCAFQDMQAQARPGEIVIEGKLNDVEQKVSFSADGFRAVKRTSEVYIQPHQVRAECNQRVLARFPIEDQINGLRGAADVDFEWIDAMRDRCDELCAMKPIPADFATDHHWPANGDNNVRRAKD